MKNHHAKLFNKWVKAQDYFVGCRTENVDYPMAQTIKLQNTSLDKLMKNDLTSEERKAELDYDSRATAKNFTKEAIDEVLAKFPYAYPIHATAKNNEERIGVLTTHLPMLSGLSGDVVIFDADLEGFSIKSHLMFENQADAQTAIDAGLLKSMV